MKYDTFYQINLSISSLFMANRPPGPRIRYRIRSDPTQEPMGFRWNPVESNGIQWNPGFGILPDHSDRNPIGSYNNSDRIR